MNRWQKIARYNIIIISIGFLGSGLLILWGALNYGFPKALGGFGFLGLCGLLPLSYVIYKKDMRDKVAMDERDHVIWRKAATAGSAVLAGYLLVVSLANFVIFGEKGSISPNMFFLIVIDGFILSTYARSIVTYLQYGREGKHE